MRLRISPLLCRGKFWGKISWKPYSGDRSKSIWLIIPKSQALILSAGIRKLRLARRNYLSKYLLKSLYGFINAKFPSGLLEPLGLLLSVSLGLGCCLLWCCLLFRHMAAVRSINSSGTSTAFRATPFNAVLSTGNVINAKRDAVANTGNRTHTDIGADPSRCNADIRLSCRA